MERIDTGKVIQRCVDMIRKDGPYKSLNASPYLNICHALGIERGKWNSPDCADVLRAIIRLAHMAERGQ